jgi:hypothetical protein
VPVDIPEGYRARKGDLRVIFIDKQSGEARAVGLYVTEGPRTRSRQQVIEFPGGGGVAFRVSENPWRDQSGPTVQYLIEVSGGRSSWAKYVQAREMPCTFDEWRPFKIHVEHAVSPQSVLSGTKVFDQWWKKYGPEEARTEEGAPDE